MTRQALALSLLEEAGSRGVTTAEFMDAGVGSRYSARIMELRKAGHRITSERVREGSWRYTLLSEDEGWTPGIQALAREATVDPKQAVAATLAAGEPLPEALKLFESAA